MLEHPQERSSKEFRMLCMAYSWRENFIMARMLVLMRSMNIRGYKRLKKFILTTARSRLALTVNSLRSNREVYMSMRMHTSRDRHVSTALDTGTLVICTCLV